MRRQLSHAGGDERYKAMLETVPKRGYRLNGEVTPLAAAASVRHRLGRSGPIAAAAVAIVVAVAGLVRAVAHREEQPAASDAATSYSRRHVLPFVDLSPEQDQGTSPTASPTKY